eukprot:COSAG06_NODE_3706_length_4994_cov_5.256588_5_plen_65_part_00
MCVLFSHLYLKMIFLPGQARDKHRENCNVWCSEDQQQKDEKKESHGSTKDRVMFLPMFVPSRSW